MIRSYKSCSCRPLCLRCCWWFQVLFLLLFFVFVNGLSNRALIVLPLLQHFVHLMRSIVDAAQFLLPSLDCHMQFHKLYMHIYTNIFIPITTHATNAHWLWSGWWFLRCRYRSYLPDVQIQWLTAWWKNLKSDKDANFRFCSIIKSYTFIWLWV